MSVPVQTLSARPPLMSRMTIPIFALALSQFAPVLLSRSWSDPDSKEALFDNTGLVMGAIVTGLVLALYTLFALLKSTRVRHTWLDRIMLVYALWAGVSLLVGYTYANPLLYWLGDFWQVVSLPIAYFATRRYLADQRDARTTLTAVVWACGIFVLYNLLRSLLTLDAVYVRFGGAFGIYVLLMALLPVVFAGRRSPAYARVFFGAAVLSLLLTGARYNMVLFAAMFAAYWGYSSFVRGRPGLSAVLILIAAVSLINLVRFQYMGRSGYNEFLTSHFAVLVQEGSENYTVTYRLEEAEAAYRQVQRRERLLLGEGLGGMLAGMRDNLLGGGQKHYIHMTPALMLFRSGLIGLLIFVTLALSFVRAPMELLWRERRSARQGKKRRAASWLSLFRGRVRSMGTALQPGQLKVSEDERQNLISVWMVLVYTLLVSLKDSSSLLQNGVLLGIVLGVLGFYWALYQPERIRRSARIAMRRQPLVRPVPGMSFPQNPVTTPGRGGV